MNLYTQTFPVDGAHGTIVLVHGVGEHSGRYAHVLRALNEARWSVVAYDQYGHGRSPGKRGALPSPNALVDDLAQILDGVRDPRRIVLGHSMGGVVAARLVAEDVRKVDGLILSSPALRKELTFVERTKLKAGEAIAPNVAVGNGLDATKLSHDAEVVRAYKSDPLVHDRVTPRLVRFILDSGAIVRARARQWHVPTLLMWAGQDALVDPRGSRELAWNAPEGVITAKEFPELYHEIFNEGDARVFETMTQWLRQVQ